MPFEFDAETKRNTNFTEYARQQEEAAAAKAKQANGSDPTTSAGDPTDLLQPHSTVTNPSRRGKIQSRPRRHSLVGRVYEQPAIPEAQFIPDSEDTEPIPVSASANARRNSAGHREESQSQPQPPSHYSSGNGVVSGRRSGSGSALDVEPQSVDNSRHQSVRSERAGLVQ